MREQSEPETMDEFGLCRLADLLQCVMDVVYDAYVGISLEVHQHNHWKSMRHT
jgi:hypothetical protein